MLAWGTYAAPEEWAHYGLLIKVECYVRQNEKVGRSKKVTLLFLCFRFQN